MPREVKGKQEMPLIAGTSGMQQSFQQQPKGDPLFQVKLYAWIAACIIFSVVCYAVLFKQ